jgi:hypothetical protein
MRRRRLWGLFGGLCVLLSLAYSGEAIDERVQLTGVLRVQWSDAQGAQGSDGFSLGLARIGARFRATSRPRANLSWSSPLARAGRAAELAGRICCLAAQTQISGRGADACAAVLRCARADCDS